MRPNRPLILMARMVVSSRRSDLQRFVCVSVTAARCSRMTGVLAALSRRQSCSHKTITVLK